MYRCFAKKIIPNYYFISITKIRFQLDRSSQYVALYLNVQNKRKENGPLSFKLEGNHDYFGHETFVPIYYHTQSKLPCLIILLILIIRQYMNY